MAMPELDADELASVIAAVKEKFALEPLRRALAKLDPASVPKPALPRAPLPQAGRTRSPGSRR
jgi:hypothetical protein